jgi:hypothetical protein
MTDITHLSRGKALELGPPPRDVLFAKASKQLALESPPEYVAFA